MITPGSYTFGPADGRLLLNVFRDGLAKKIGHDLIMEVGKWSAEATVADPIAASSLTFTADLTTIMIAEAKGGAKPLSDKDKRDILATTANDILLTGKHPTTTFKSSTISGGLGGTVNVAGTLTLVGTSRPVQVEITSDATTAKATARIVQSEFGIKIFKAFMGALKLQDGVTLELQVPLPA